MSSFRGLPTMNWPILIAGIKRLNAILSQAGGLTRCCSVFVVTLLLEGLSLLMKSSTTPDFWATYAALLFEVKARARVSYRLWQHNSRHPSLQFKKTGNVWSVRIGGGYRALALLEEDVFYWFWIGTHDDYERLIGLY